MRIKAIVALIYIGVVGFIASPAIFRYKAANKEPEPLVIGLTAVVRDPDIGPLAVIEYGSEQKQEVVFPGTEVIANTYLVAVESNGIVLSKNGSTLFLRIGENLGTDVLVERSHEISNGTKITVIGDNLDEARIGEQAARKWDFFGRVLAAMLKSNKRRINQGPYTGAVRIEFEPEWYFKRIGIRRNDIILELNGRSLADLDRAEITRIFSDNYKLSLSLIRDGERIPLTFEAF